jgi:hypothetical protein
VAARGGAFVHQRADLLGGTIETLGQHVARMLEKRLQAVEVVGGRHQMVLKIGRRQQGQRRTPLGRLGGFIHQAGAPRVALLGDRCARAHANHSRAKAPTRHFRQQGRGH